MPKIVHAPLSAEFVRSILIYNPNTGLFTWRERTDRARNWNTRNAGFLAGSTHKKRGYVRIQIEKGMHYPAHVLAWLYVHGEWRPDEIDHRNGNRSDNRISELRIATPSQNGINKAMQRNNKSGAVGVHFVQQCGKWEGVITQNRKRIWRHFFDSKEEAAAARAEKARELQNEFVPSVDARPRYFHSRDEPSS